MYCTEKCRKRAEQLTRWKKRNRVRTHDARVARYEDRVKFSRSLESLRNRLEARTLPEPNSGCWLWLGAVTNDGYGAIGHGKRSLSNAQSSV